MLSPDFMMGLAILFYLVEIPTVVFVLVTRAFERAPVPLQRAVRTLAPLGMFSLTGFFTLRLLGDYGISIAAAPLPGEVFWVLGIVVLTGGFIASAFMYALARGPRQPSLPQREPPHDT
jgi:hypothetical protein